MLIPSLQNRKIALFILFIMIFSFGLITVVSSKSGHLPLQQEGTGEKRPLRESELIAQQRALPDYDIRRESRAVINSSQAQAARDLQARLGSGTIVNFDAGSGGVSQVFRQEGYLTTSKGGSPMTNVSQFLVQNLGLLGMSQTQMASFKSSAEDRDKKTGVTHVYLQQQFSGLQVFGSSLKGHVDAGGRIISIEGNYYPASSSPNAPAKTVSAQDALIAALQSTLPDVLAKVSQKQNPAQPGDGNIRPAGPAYQFPSVQQAESGADHLTIFEKGPFANPIRVRQVIFPTAQGARLAWQVEVHAMSRQAYYVMVVDAATKKLLYRTNTYRYAEASNASVFTKNPDETPLSIQNYFGEPDFSPQGWSTAQATIGNNVQADSATSTGDFIYPFTDAWNLTGANNFDLTGQRIRFTPTDALATGYTTSTSIAGSTAPAATNLLPFFTNTDNGTINLICGGGWTQNILGGTFTSFWVNTNGSVSLGAGIVDSFASKVSFANDARRIAGLWRDLNPGGGGTLTGDCAPEGGGQRVRVVWDATPNSAGGGSHTFVITLHGIGTGLDNIIDVDYGSVSSLTGELVGVGGNAGTPFDPRTTGVVNYADLSTAPQSSVESGGLAQTFPDPDLNLSITNLGYQLNKMHDFYYGLGFTEAEGNYQTSNFDKGGAPLDPVQGEAQYGVGKSNTALFSFTPDGTPGFTGFGLFSTNSDTCRRDSGLDAGVIYHEFTHGVSTRMVGGPQNVSVLGSFQGSALGEGWSDAFATSILNDPVLGAYVVCSPAGLRSAPYNAHPGKYSDFGNKDGPFAAGIGSVFAPEPHRDGEIWGATAWDIHTSLGEPITQKLLFEGLRYTPVEPSMVDAKNAVFIADQVLYNGAHLKALYSIFAARGLGVTSSSSPGSFDAQPSLDGWTSAVFAAFDTPPKAYGNAELVLFQDDFEGPNLGWTMAGVDGAGGGSLWHLSSRRSSSSSKSYYYGQENTGDYNTGFRNYGSLISPPIVLPTTVGDQALMLEWDQNRQTADSFFFDGGFVRIIEVGPGTRTQVAFVQNTRTSLGGASFARNRVNLNAFAGKTIQIEFFMDTFDSIANAAEGWYIDNVKFSILGAPINAGFENGTVSPWLSFGVSGSVGTLNPRHGAYALQETSGSGAFYQDVSGAVPGQVYLVSAWVRADTAGATAPASLRVADTTGTNVVLTTIPGPVGTSYRLVTATFIATATGQFRIRVQRGPGTGTLFWDDVSIKLGNPPGSNLGFETGSLPPWTVTGAVSATVQSAVTEEGSYALQETGGAGGVFQDVDGLTPGQQYRIFARARTAVGTTGQMQLNVNDSTGANTVTDGFRTPPSNVWTTFTVNFVATTSGKARIQLLWNGGAGTGYWDSVSIFQGNPPAPTAINPGFETGSQPPWPSGGTVASRTVTSTKSHHGLYSLQMSGATGAGGGVRQDVSGLIPGRQYKIGVWVSGNPQGTAPAKLAVSDPSGANTVFTTTGVGSAWQFIQVTFTATQQGIARIKLHIGPGTGAIVYDDVEIQQ